jgi:O-antigen ligase
MSPEHALILLLPVEIVIFLCLFCYPEITFAVFIFSYVVEGGQRLLYVPLSAIMLVITAAGFLLPITLGRKTYFKLNASDLSLWLFVMILFIGSYLAPDPQYGFMKAGRFFMAVFVPYVLTRVFMKRYDQLKRFLVAILGIASGVAIALIALSALQKSSGRMYFLEANPIPVAVLFSVGLIVAIIGALEHLWGDSKLGKVYSIIIIPVLLYGLLLTASRGPLIALAIGLVSYYVFRGQSIWRVNLRLALTSTVIIIAITFGSTIWNLFQITTIPNIYYYNPEFVLRGLPTLERLEKYSTAITLFKQNPLLGVGTNGYELLTEFGYPHNIFLEIAVENGLLGLIAFGCFLMFVSRQGFRYVKFHLPKLNKQMQGAGLIVIVITISLLIEKQFSFALDMNKDLFTFLGLVVNLPTMVSSGKYPRNQEANKQV